MNSISKFSLALFTTLALGAITGCGANGSFDQMDAEPEFDSEEAVAETEQALTAETAPVLSSGTLYRVEIMQQTSAEDPAQKCVDFPGSLVSLGQPLVRRTCNNQQLENNNNTQAFYFEPVYVGGVRVPNRYYMKPAHTLASQDLCVYNSGATTANGGNLLAGNCNPGTDARLVDIKAYVDEGVTGSWHTFLTINMVHSGKCLTVVGSYSGENVTITQYGTSDNSQLFCAVWPNQRVHILTQ
jgi:hypothetical protein